MTPAVIRVTPWQGRRAPQPTPPRATPAGEPGVGIVMDDVSVRAAGRELLRDVNLTIEPGEHIAVVGMSGTGRSTLVGLLLGWNSASSGRRFVEGRPLDATGLARLRRTTAWVDPAIQLWNRSLLDKLEAGHIDLPDARCGGNQRL